MRVIVVLMALTGLFLSFDLLACDGIQPTCPATEETATLWQHGSHGTGEKQFLASGYIYSSEAEAIGAACSKVPATLPDNTSKTCSNPAYGNSVHTYTVTSCPKGTSGSGFSKSMYYEYSHFTRFCNSGGTTSTTYLNSVNISILGKVFTNQVCTLPLYPVGPDAQNNCTMSTCSSEWKGVSWESGQNGQIWTHPEGANSLCHKFSNGDRCEANVGGIGVCSQSGCVAGGVTFTGKTCSENTPINNNSNPPCSTHGDGRETCISNSNNPQGQPHNDGAPNPPSSNNGVGQLCTTNAQGKSGCISVEPPSINCIEQPANAGCANPVPTNCGFVNGQYNCRPRAANCGAINGMDVCIQPDGGITAWDGQSTSQTGIGVGGAGTGAGTSGGGQDGQFDGVFATGRCSDGGKLNMDCLFEDLPDAESLKVNENSLNDKQDLTDFISKIGEQYNHGIENPQTNALMLSGGSCAPYSLNLGITTVQIPFPCAQLGWVRAILEWLLNGAMIFIGWKRFREAI